MLRHLGLKKLANKEYEESIGEMKHADKLMGRIVMLDALPNLQDLGKLRIGLPAAGNQTRQTDPDKVSPQKARRLQTAAFAHDLHRIPLRGKGNSIQNFTGRVLN